ncbi:MAG TPA: hypothetical protein VLT87_06490 [Thermoanaerobaculia bacterium]|nr:hypothetical protein [Thermoanaerobaculia bacterium]
MKRILPTLSLVALSLYAAACGGNDTPVAQVKVEPRDVRLVYPGVAPVRLSWTPVAPLGEGIEPMVFVHLLDDRDTVVRTFDHAFPQAWREGTPVAYDVKLYQSALGEPLAPGKYRLTVGLYGKERKRWALEGLGEDLGRNEYLAGEVRVPAQQQGPRFAFSQAWLPKEPGGDRQVLARRWVFKRGAIRVLDVKEPGSVWMVVRIPDASGGGEELVLDEGAKTPSLLVSGSCGSVETNVSGPGYHEIELPMEPPPAGQFCRILLRPNFHMKPTGGPGRPRSVSLENIGWVSGPGQAKAEKPAAAAAAAP